MTALSIQPTFPTFTGADGQPLENGYIWVGTANLNPITNPITVYWDAALSAPATQPIRTLGGYPSNSGTPARLYVNSDYSIQVLDRKGSVVYSAPVATDRYGGGIINANIVVYDPSGTGAVATTVQGKLRESVSVKDFGAVGDGVTDDTAAIQAAIDYAKATSGIKCIEFPSASYKTSASVNIHGGFVDGLSLIGNKSTVTCSGNTPVFSFDGTSPAPAPEYRMNHVIDGFTLIGSGIANTNSRCIQVVGGSSITVNNCILKNAYKGLYLYGALICDFTNVTIRECVTGFEALDNVSFAPNSLNFVNCKFLVNTVAIRGINFDYGIWNFYGCEIEGNNYVVPGTDVDGVRVCEFFAAGEVNFYGCHFESNYGQYHIFYSGDRHLNFVGSKLIPSGVTGKVGYVVYMASGNLAVIGTHITYNFGPNIYLTATAFAHIIGGTGSSVSGTIQNATWNANGRFISGAASDADPGAAYYAYLPKNNKAFVSQSDNSIFEFKNAAGTRIAELSAANGASGALWNYQAYGWEFGADNAYRMLVGRSGSASVESGIDNAITLGSAALRWSTVYAGTGTINTSDARTKQQIRTLSEAERAVAVRLKSLIRSFKFNDSVTEKGDAARIHFGVIAQDVKAAFEAEGLVAEQYALLCHDQWDDVRIEVKDENGKPTGEQSVLTVAGDRYGVRYEELLAFIISVL